MSRSESAGATLQECRLPEPPPGFARPATCPWNAIRAVGGTGTTIIVRLSAFLVFCIGIQVFWNGARELLLELMAAAT